MPTIYSRPVVGIEMSEEHSLTYIKKIDQNKSASIITVKEARKLIGASSDKMTDDDITQNIMLMQDFASSALKLVLQSDKVGYNN